MRDSSRSLNCALAADLQTLTRLSDCYASERKGCHHRKRNINLLNQNARSLPAVSAVIAILAAAIPSAAQVVPGLVFDPPVTTNPAPAQPGELQGTISAPQLTTGEKFGYRVVQSFGLRNFIGAAIGATIGQELDSPHEWGQGVGGFAERYASSFAGTFSREAFAFTLETALHEDPRFFPLSRDASFKARMLNALRQVVWSKRDDGSSGIAYARIISTFGGAEFTNVWQPASTGGQGNAFKRAFIGFGADFGYNFLQEFIPFVRPISLRHRH